MVAMDDTPPPTDVGASAPEPALVARQARAGVDGRGELTESPSGDDAPSTGRVDARAAALPGTDDTLNTDPGNDTATPAGLADDDPLTRP